MKRSVVTIVVAVALASVLSGCEVITSRLISRQQPTSCLVTTYNVLDASGQPVDAATLEATATIVGQRLSKVGTSPISVEQSSSSSTLTVQIGESANAADVATWISQAGQIAAVPVSAEFADRIEVGQPLPAGMSATPIFDSTGIASVEEKPDATTNRPSVELVLRPDAAAALDAFAKQVYDGSLTTKFAIVVDGTVVLALTLMSDHFNGDAELAGLTGDDAMRFAALAASGPLPAALDIASSVSGACSVTG
jgi:hypothetical protein